MLSLHGNILYHAFMKLDPITSSITSQYTSSKETFCFVHFGPVVFFFNNPNFMKIYTNVCILLSFNCLNFSYGHLGFWQLRLDKKLGCKELKWIGIGMPGWPKSVECSSLNLSSGHDLGSHRIEPELGSVLRGVCLSPSLSFLLPLPLLVLFPPSLSLTNIQIKSFTK